MISWGASRMGVGGCRTKDDGRGPAVLAVGLEERERASFKSMEFINLSRPVLVRLTADDAHRIGGPSGDLTYFFK